MNPNYFSKFVDPAQIHQNYWLRLTKKSEFGRLAVLPRFFSQHPTIVCPPYKLHKDGIQSISKRVSESPTDRFQNSGTPYLTKLQYTADKEVCPRGLSHRGCVNIRRGSRIPGFSPTSKRHFWDQWDNNYLSILFYMCWKLNHCRGWNQTYKMTLWRPIFQNQPYILCGQ